MRHEARLWLAMLAVVVILGALVVRPAAQVARVVVPRPTMSDSPLPSVAGMVARYGPAAAQALGPACRRGGLAWPPRRVWLLAFKRERRLEAWAANAAGPYHHLATWPILAASGHAGVKRRFGDHQVPEGSYRLTTLNPASQFHLSLRVDYPNAEDLRHAVVPREQLGGDIYVHGGQRSVGCLALGDEVIETVFCLVAQADRPARRILIAPCDLRCQPAPDADDPWVAALYGRLRAKLREFPRE